MPWSTPCAFGIVDCAMGRPRMPFKMKAHHMYFSCLSIVQYVLPSHDITHVVDDDGDDGDTVSQHTLGLLGHLFLRSVQPLVDLARARSVRRVAHPWIEALWCALMVRHLA